MVMPCSRSARRPSVSSARSAPSKAALAGDPLDRVELVGEDRLGVVQQPADQGGLAVVDLPAVARRSSDPVARSWSGVE
jgi:hypothetical protein